MPHSYLGSLLVSQTQSGGYPEGPGIVRGGGEGLGGGDEGEGVSVCSAILEEGGELGLEGG